MNLSRLVFTVLMLVTTVVANADVSPDRAGSCYIFKDSKLSQRGVCLISSEISHGHEFRELSFEGKTYKLYYNGNISTEKV